MDFQHRSVLLTECIDALQIRPEGTYVDGTLGGGGHSIEICKRLTSGRLIGIDQDTSAILAATQRLAPFLDKVTMVHSNFTHLSEILENLQISSVDGILLDIGVSSHQLDEGSRGFSYQQDAPLDMRMDADAELTAATVVNTYSPEDLIRILYEYGEERWAKRIVAFLIEARAIALLQTTGELVEVIKKAIPKGARRDGPHPAKRTFQAIRIEVNQELTVLEHAIEAGIHALSPGGRLCIITFHSLEDRIVKNGFRHWENPCVCPPQFPVCVCGNEPKGRVITRKPILPSADELAENHRARSAKLRVFEKK